MNPDEFYRRRKALMRLMGPNSIAIIPAAPQLIRNNGVHYSYRQNSDFYYLTGFNEPEAIAVLSPGKDVEYTLFCRNRDPAKAIWYGDIAGTQGAVRQFGADAAFSIEEIDKKLLKMLKQSKRLYYSLGYDVSLDLQLGEWLNTLRKKIRSGMYIPNEIHLLDHHLHELRLIKSSNEIQAMRTAANISAQAHKHLMQKCHPGPNEYEVEDAFVHECMRNGARNCAYQPIIGSGKNSCVLHYETNNDILNDGDMVLIDAGCEYDNYASDITRTFPINGHFNSQQTELYELVLEAQTAALKQLRPGNTWQDIHKAALQIITKGLLHLGVFKGTTKSLTKLIKSKRYKPFYMHRIGHWLGMDVHDVGNYKQDDNKFRQFKPYMCLTVEPGIYIAQDAMEAEKHWRGMGVRIEDDVVITADGYEILSVNVPKTVKDIEALMND